MTRKIAISLLDDLVEQARRAVESGGAPSVSAYIAEAMSERGRRERLADVLGEMLADPADR
jgi:Arc/MetJ-type ribon-helix-helix transcriptional regulator